MNKINVEVNLDRETLKKARELYDNLGLDLDTALNMFLKASVLKSAIPFVIEMPKEDKKVETKKEVDFSDCPKINPATQPGYKPQVERRYSSLSAAMSKKRYR